jgi:hypothetical protein
MESDFPRITVERMREVMAKGDSFAHAALNARFNYKVGRGRGWCSCCGEVKVCADWLPGYQVCSTCFNAALPDSQRWHRAMSEDEAAAVEFYTLNPSAALFDLGQRLKRNAGVRSVEAPSRISPACGVHGPIPCEGARCICADAPGVPAPGATPEPWMTSYSAEPRTTDGTDYIITKVATQEFQLYRHEAAHLHALLGRALGVGSPDGAQHGN